MRPVVLEVDNTRVRVREAPDWAIWSLRDRMAYLSPSAREAGFEAPAPVDMGPDADAPEYQWDGMVRLVRVPKARKDGTRAPPWFETGLLQRALAILAEIGLQARILDYRTRPPRDEDVPLFWPPPGSPLFDYQEHAVGASLHYGRGVVVAPPRAGKTRILLELARRLNVPAIWVAPTTSIVDQTVAAALAYGFPAVDVVSLEGPVDVAKVGQARLWICTAAKAMSLRPDAAATRAAVIVDEVHHFTNAGDWGRKLHELFAHVYHWFGASGTYFRSAGDDMALEAFLSGIVYRITSAELLARGRLVPTRLGFVPVDGPALKRGQDTRKAGIIGHEYRNALAAAGALNLAGEHRRRVLVMVATKEQGRAIAELCKRHGPGGTRNGWESTEFLFRGRGGPNSRADRSFRERLLRAFLDGDGPDILIGTSLLGEGVDLPDADAIVWARGEKAAVSYCQGLYRVCTARAGKTDALALDFADRHHPSLLAASQERLAIAFDDPVFRCEVLPSASDIAAWAARKVA